MRGAAIAQSVVREWPSADRLQMRDTKRKKSARMGIEPSASAHEKIYTLTNYPIRHTGFNIVSQPCYITSIMAVASDCQSNIELCFSCPHCTTSPFPSFCLCPLLPSQIHFWPQAKTSSSLTVMSPTAKPTVCHPRCHLNEEEDNHGNSNDDPCRLNHAQLEPLSFTVVY